MILILSPSKKQTITNKQPQHTCQPAMIDQASMLVALLKSFSQDQLAELMKTSPKLTEQTMARIIDFSAPHMPDISGAALTTFQGDAFAAIATDTYNDDDFNFANKHIRILSGLYGILRPLDLIQPYRLEMATRLKSKKGKTLYDFWNQTITNQLNYDIGPRKDNVIVNCASQEYAKVIIRDKLNCEMITVTFRQKKKGITKTIAIYAKRARGMFVDYVIRNRITEKKQLSAFDSDGYCFLPRRSTTTELVFIKKLE